MATGRLDRQASGIVDTCRTRGKSEESANPCDGNLTFVRAFGDAACDSCGKEYWRHPYCGNSRVGYPYEFARPEYVLHVLCDGLHVKL